MNYKERLLTCIDLKVIHTYIHIQFWGWLSLTGQETLLSVFKEFKLNEWRDLNLQVNWQFQVIYCCVSCKELLGIVITHKFHNF